MYLAEKFVEETRSDLKYMLRLTSISSCILFIVVFICLIFGTLTFTLICSAIMFLVASILLAVYYFTIRNTIHYVILNSLDYNRNFEEMKITMKRKYEREHIRKSEQIYNTLMLNYRSKVFMSLFLIYSLAFLSSGIISLVVFEKFTLSISLIDEIMYIIFGLYILFPFKDNYDTYKLSLDSLLRNLLSYYRLLFS